VLQPDLASQPYCYLTTTGRRTGGPHTIEIWFGVSGDTLYILAGGRERSDSVRNARAQPEVRLRVGDTTFAAKARFPSPESDEDALARRLLLAKYAPGYSGNLDNWGRTSLPVAFDLERVVSTDATDALWPRGRRG
jgi:deazaflavin-dependent oxidoreductase (nitroreductase family)